MERENLTWRTLAMLLEELIITVFCWVEDCFESVIGGVKG